MNKIFAAFLMLLCALTASATSFTVRVGGTVIKDGDKVVCTKYDVQQTSADAGTLILNPNIEVATSSAGTLTITATALDGSKDVQLTWPEDSKPITAAGASATKSIEANTVEQIGISLQKDFEYDCPSETRQFKVACAMDGDAIEFTLTITNSQCGYLTGEPHYACYTGTTDATVEIAFMNKTGKSVSFVDIECSFNGTKRTVKDLFFDLSSGFSKSMDMWIPAVYSTGEYPVTLKVVRVDDEIYVDGMPLVSNVAVVDCSFSRVLVAEENTGTGCGFCPRGIVAIEKMRNKYPDTFLPIAVHQFNTDDPMYPVGYEGAKRYFNGAPQVIVNRNKDFHGDPDNLEWYYNDYIKQAPIAKVAAEFEWIDSEYSKVRLTAKSQFAFSGSGANYRIAFVVLEDGVDKDQEGRIILQGNSYANNQFGALGEWSETSLYRVPTTYDDVARCIFSYDGIENSIPEAIEKGVEYTYSEVFEMPYVLRPQRVRFAALLINTNTGKIENAGSVFVDPSGIGSIAADETATDIEYFNLSGTKVQEISTPGIYIRRCGSKTEKVIVK